MAGTDQNKSPAPLKIDAGDFLRTINRSAQAKIVYVENLIKKLGQQAGKNYELTALDNNAIVFEDKSNHSYYSAEIQKNGNRVRIDNIRQIIVNDDRKSDDFDGNVKDLVESLSKDDTKGAERAFRLIELQRFRPTVIPESGIVTTRDGKTRHVPITRALIPEDKVKQISEAFIRATKDRVEITEGRVVRGDFLEDNTKVAIPVTELTRRRVVARTMKEAARNAYLSESFCSLIENIAELVKLEKLEEAVETATKFFSEEQEFCLLKEGEMLELIENSLATSLNFNSILAENVCRLIYKTNLKVNKADIIEAWTKTSALVHESTLLEAVKDLENSDNFSEDYQDLLDSVLNESGDILEARARAYLIALRMLRSVLANVEGEEAAAESLAQMIEALESGNLDTDTIMQAEALLASVSDDIIDSVETFETFDNEPDVDVDLSNEPDIASEPLEMPDIPGFEEPAGMEEPMGALDMGGAPAPEMAGAGAPPMGGGMGMPGMESRDTDVVPIEEMTVRHLSDELRAWQVEGHTFLMEDGYDDCRGQMDRYIKRCVNIGPACDFVRIGFESIRDGMLHGNLMESRKDPYSNSAKVIYKIFEDENQGSGGVEKSSVKETDGGGSAGGKSAGKGAPPSGTPRMDELQGKKTVQKKNVESDGMPKSDTKMKGSGKGHSQDGTSLAENVAMDKPTGNGLQDKGVTNVDGRSANNQGSGSGSHGDHKMGAPTGKGVVGKGTSSSDGRKSGTTEGGSGLEGGDAGAGEPADGIQKKVGSGQSNPGKGVAESKSCPCSDDGECQCDSDCDCGCASVDETQYKWGTKRKAQGGEGGYKKARYENEYMEDIEAIAKTLDESIEVTISSDNGDSWTYRSERVDPSDAISKIVSALDADSMMGGEEEMDMDMGDEAPLGDESPIDALEEPMDDMGEEPMDDMGEEPMDDMDDMGAEDMPMDDMGDDLDTSSEIDQIAADMDAEGPEGLDLDGGDEDIIPAGEEMEDLETDEADVAADEAEIEAGDALDAVDEVEDLADEAEDEAEEAFDEVDEAEDEAEEAEDAIDDEEALEELEPGDDDEDEDEEDDDEDEEDEEGNPFAE